MNPTERRASASLAFIYALRMLGLFLVLPVFALEARRYPGGDDPGLVGLAMGIYGLTQGLLQIPFGIASDRWGRKRVIAAGLLLFAVGSFVAAAAETMAGLTLGRALQGAGAVSAAVTALLADQTRDVVRTKAMALVGASIGLMFALSLVLAPPLAGAWGLSGLFVTTGVLALTGVAVLLWVVPAAPPVPVKDPAAGPGPGMRSALAQLLASGPTLRLYFGVFVLHAVLLAMWVAVPALLERAGLPQARHWQVYLPAVVASFGVMGATLFPLERRGYLRAAFLAAVALVALVQVGLWAVAGQAQPPVLALGALLFLFFCGSNVLEACQPSIASRTAPPAVRGAALGVYNTLQSLGFFAGGLAGGWLTKQVGQGGLFLACGAALLVWLAIAWPMRAPPPPADGQAALAT